MRIHLGWMTIAGTWLAFSAAVCVAQTAPASNPAPCTVAPQPEPCGTKPATSAKPDAAQKFPFPGEPSTPPAAPPSIGGVPDAPDAPSTAAPAAKGDATKKFPFPGEPGKPDLDSSGSSSSSSSTDDAAPIDPSAAADTNVPADPGLKDKGSEGTTSGRHILHRVNPVGTKLQTPDERVAEDLDVAHFYTQTGDLEGAYLRSKDAVKTEPDDPDAHFALAEIAAKLNKADEAIAEYNACLKLDASDKQIKESRKALARLQHH